MAKLDPEQRRLADEMVAVSRRSLLIPWALFVVIVLSAVVFLVKAPFVLNPFHVADAIQDGTYPADLYPLTAMLFPLAMDFALVVALILFIIVLGFGKRQRELGRLIVRLQEEQDE